MRLPLFSPVVLMTSLVIVASLQDAWGAENSTRSAQYVLTQGQPLAEIAGPKGAEYVEDAIFASNTLHVPVDLLLAHIRTESDFQRKGCVQEGSQVSCGMGQISRQEWMHTGSEPEIVALGLVQNFTAARHQTKKGGLNPRWNIMALASAIRKVHRAMTERDEASRDHFGENLASWLASSGGYNGGASIWSTIYNLGGSKARELNWEIITAKRLVKLTRTGHGDHTRFFRHAVANHIARVSSFLFQTGVEYCRIDWNERELTSDEEDNLSCKALKIGKGS